MASKKSEKKPVKKSTKKSTVKKVTRTKKPAESAATTVPPVKATVDANGVVIMTPVDPE